MDGAYDKSVDLWSMGVITYVVYVNAVVHSCLMHL